MRTALLPMLLWTVFSFGADDDLPGKDAMNRWCQERMSAWGHSAARTPHSLFSKSPNEITITFQRRHGEVITELVDMHHRTQSDGRTVYAADREMFDADKPGSQYYAALPEDSVAKAAETVARIANEAGIYKAVVKVDDTGNVVFLEFQRLSQDQFLLQRLLQRKLLKKRDPEPGTDS